MDSARGEQQKDYRFLSEIVANEKELDIRAYTLKIKEELNRLEEECITDFLTINKDVGTLYHELNKSTSILNKIEKVVDSFQHELGDISNQVSILQEKSQSYNVSLKNRKQLEKTIHSYLSSFLVPQDLIETLCNAEIDHQDYLEKVGHLNSILMHSRKADITDSKALQQIRPELDKLRLKVCSRARSFLMVKMNNLKKPKTNFQILQESVLLKFKPLLVFLKENSQETYVELTNYYAEIMDKVYYQLLKTYMKETQKLVEERVSKHDLIVIDESLKHKTNTNQSLNSTLDMGTMGRYNNTEGTGQMNMNNSILSSRSQQVPQYIPTSVFDIEDRLQILDRIDSSPLVTHMSQQKQRKYAVEEIFRSQNRILIEAISKEFVFILEFFDLKIGQCSYIFNQIFSKTVNYYLDWIKNYSQNNLHDLYASLLIILINEENKKIMLRNKIPVLDYYFDKVNQLVWPRFTQIFENYNENLKKVNVKQFKLYGQANVHQSTIRYIDFVSGLYRIANVASQDMLILRLSQIKSRQGDLCLKMAREHFEGEKEQIVYLINNYDYMYQHLKNLNLEKGIQDVIAIEKELNQFMEKLIKIILKENYPGLEDIVSQYCLSGDTSSDGSEDESQHHQMPKTIKKIDFSTLNLKLIENVAQDFAQNYRAKTDLIAKEIKQSIQIQQSMQQLFQRFMRVLMLRYSSFVELVKTAHPSYYKEMPSAHLVLLDLKNSAANMDL
ncbi:vacuolar protein sorting-associated protein 52 homolog [Stylonychia lemnae]|uniref:Vacuolar protein sorting-associated protein 52 homolog n=1 Tax=Stylonychia lemnae TaxID=5949 RepID=A0A078AEK5_STYLE|nr:vacuolar protein sorting-associated protein 52 homolog [Stylonychia lemnae]|eukprot:CDW80276.1 vacuolar protein sorting-associated protein 52 homolog [Stylonychia lemnae]